MVRAGDRVTFEGPLPESVPLQPAPEPELAVEVIYLDDNLVALAKPPGLPSHPLRAGERGTLANALVARFPECAAVGEDPREAGLVHRLDRDTSGLLLAARNAATWHSLRQAFREGRVRKEYVALVAGVIQVPGEIDLPLAHHPRDHRRMRVARPGEPGQSARTQFAPLASGENWTLLRVQMSTGRMHQVRVHLAHVGHSLVGDSLYGGPAWPSGLPGHFLHAWRIALPHPSGNQLLLACPLFQTQQEVLLHLGATLPEEMSLTEGEGRLVSKEP